MKKYRVFCEIGGKLRESENRGDFHSIGNYGGGRLTLWRKTEKTDRNQKAIAVFKNWEYFLIDDET